MPWFYVDDGFSDSKPVMNMPDRHRLAACGLWVLAGSWSAKEELDGFVPKSKLRQLGVRPPILSALTDSGPMSAPLCAEVPGGLQFNSWDKWQPTKAELEAERIENARKREADAERKRLERAEKNVGVVSAPRRRRKGRTAVTSADIDISHSEDGAPSDLCPTGQTADVQRDSRAGAGARLDPTRPDPTRSSSSLVTSSGGVTSADAYETAPRPQCPDHEGNHLGPCRWCQARREWDEAHADKLEAKRLERAAADQAAADRAVADCPLCDDHGWLLGADGTPVEPSTRCAAHQPKGQRHA